MNKIYFFTGTGNSLHMAKKIAEQLGDCEIVAIKKGADKKIAEGCERIGFVFPTYGWAAPLMVANFLKKSEFPKQGDTWFFAVTTCGGMALNALPQAKALLYKKGIRLNYGNRIKMFSNSVVNYKMGKQPEKKAAESDIDAISIIEDIKHKRSRKIPKVNKFLFRLHQSFMKTMPAKTRDYNVNSGCISCGICESVCPAGNIEMKDGKPQFHEHCEGCVACIQHCPKQAINYRDKTQKRGRYVHPSIRTSEIVKYYVNK